MKKPLRPLRSWEFLLIILVSAISIKIGSSAVMTEFYKGHSRWGGDFVLQGEQAVIHGWGMVLIGLGFMIGVIGLRLYPESIKLHRFVLISGCLLGSILIVASSWIGR